MQVDSLQQDPEPRLGRSQRHRQDDPGERAALRRRGGQPLRTSRGRQRRHRFRPRGGGARNLHRARRLPPAVARPQDQPARLTRLRHLLLRDARRRCASPTPRSSASAPWPASRSTPRRPGRPPPSSSCRSSSTSTRWIASEPTSDALSRRLQKTFGRQVLAGPAADRRREGLRRRGRPGRGARPIRFERDGNGKGKEAPIPAELATRRRGGAHAPRRGGRRGRRSTCSRSSSRRARSTADDLEAGLRAADRAAARSSR